VVRGVGYQHLVVAVGRIVGLQTAVVALRVADRRGLVVALFENSTMVHLWPWSFGGSILNLVVDADCEFD